MIAALQMLNLSVDIDHLTAGSPCVTIESYDDTDSLSELLIEMVTGNSHFVPENKTDDQSPFQKQLYKMHSFVFFSNKRNAYELQPFFRQVKRRKEMVFNTAFQQEDFSTLLCQPPEPATTA